MRKGKKVGTLLLIIGVFIPLISYPFTSLTSRAQAARALFAVKGAAYHARVEDLEVVLVKGEWAVRSQEEDEGHYQGRLAVPYRYALAFGITLSFVGVGLMAFSSNREPRA